MNANTDIDLTELHDAIVADIKAAFPDLKTVQFYPGELENDLRSNLPKPACLLSLTEFEAQPDIDPGTEQLAVLGAFEAELVIGFRTERAQHAIRHLAAALAAWLHKRKWTNPKNPAKKLPTGPAMVAGAYRDDFHGRTNGQRDATLEQYEVWRVEWNQVFHLGNTVWLDGGITPTPVFSWAPDIGPGHENDYQPIVPPAGQLHGPKPEPEQAVVINELAINVDGAQP